MNKYIAITFFALILGACSEKKEERKLYDESQSSTETDVAAPTSTDSTGLSVGDIAPEIVLSNPQGQTIALSSLRGKYVLVDFWASWCGPCRRENPNNVRLYQEYKDKGFEIYGVSLDAKKQDWKNAIEADHLTWPQVSDLGYWRSSVVPLYNISSIPSTVLLDKKGRIIARDLRGEQLAAKLKEVIGS